MHKLAGKAVAAGFALAKRPGAKISVLTALNRGRLIASSDTGADFMEHQKAAEYNAARILSQVSTVQADKVRTC